MNIEPEDDLDITAELPQLDLQAAQLQYSMDDTAIADYMTASVSDVAATSGSNSARKNARSVWSSNDPGTDSTGGWPTVDELISVRDKIVDLEAALLEAELKLSKLDKQHQELLMVHVALGAREAEAISDRDRLDAELIVLLESREQLQQQFTQHQAASAATLLELQQQLEQQRQQSDLQQAEHARRNERQRTELAQHQEKLQQLSTELANERTQIKSLESNLQTITLTQAKQEAAAAALARNLSHELLEKESLQSGLKLREQRIATLEAARQELHVQLDAIEARRVATQTNVERLQQEQQSHEAQVAELHNSLRQAEQRNVHLSEQLDLEQGRIRSAEQDKERLTRLAAAEHETYESTRKELAGRLTELSALQEHLGAARGEITALSKQLSEREALLRGRDDLLAARQQTLQLATDNQAAALQREAALTANLALLQEELRQTQAALQAGIQGHQEAELQIKEERLAKQQVQEQLQQLQAHQRQRDQFILNQAEELEQVQHAAAELELRLKRAQTAHDEQLARVMELTAEQAPLRAEHEQQALLLAQVQQELAAKQAEQGAGAKQVQALQQELHKHVEALNAIRRDIHQVAQQSRYRESELLVRTLVRIDDESVVHLLNKPVVVIGRANDADICIRSDSISRRHACLRVGRDVVIVEDLGSTNGCYVNGRRVKRQLLKDGDKLEVGDMKFRFATRISQP